MTFPENRARPHLDDRERVFLGVAAVIDLVLLGLIAHGEGRFALFSVLVLVVLGTDTLLAASAGRIPWALPGLAVAAAATWAVTAVLIAGRLERVTEVRASLADAAAAALPRPGPPVPGGCLVVVGSAPEAGWLSGCDARRPGAVRGVPDDLVVYVIDFPGAGVRPGLDRIRALAPTRTWTVRQVATTGSYSTALVAVSLPPGPSRRLADPAPAAVIDHEGNGDRGQGAGGR